MHEQIKVSVPAEPGFVALLRSVVAGVAGLQGFGVDAIDDLRLAIGERAPISSNRPRGHGARRRPRGR